jgi:hypothetical protein
MAIVVHPFLSVNPSLADSTPRMHVMIFIVAVVITLPFSSFEWLICHNPSGFNYVVNHCSDFGSGIGPGDGLKSPYLINVLFYFVIKVR